MTLFEKLHEDLPEEAIQIAKGIDTKKGYDTIGYSKQYLVNRFNEVLGIGNWNWEFKIIEKEKGQFKNGMPFVDITGEATITLKIIEQLSKGNINKEISINTISHTEYGGARSSNFADALKGASTNAFKKCAAFFGVGGKAFEGKIKGIEYIDEDNRNQGGTDKEIKKSNPKKSVQDIVELIRKITTKEKVEEFRKWIEKSNYTEIQKNVMKRTLEEVEKEICE